MKYLVNTGKGSIEVAEKGLVKNLTKEEVEVLLKANSGTAGVIKEVVMENGEEFVKLSSGKLVSKSLYQKFGVEFMELTTNSKITYEAIVDNFAFVKNVNGQKLPFWIEIGSDPSKSGWNHIIYYIRTTDTLTRIQQLADKGILNRANIGNIPELELELKNLIKNQFSTSTINTTTYEGAPAFEVILLNNGKLAKMMFGSNGFFKTIY